jgi:hypothetical protein
MSIVLYSLVNMINTSQIEYRVIEGSNKNFNALCNYYKSPDQYRLLNPNYKALFINVGHHDIDIEGHINPAKIIKMFGPALQYEFKVIKLEIYGLSSTTEYFTHFIEYTIPINSYLNYVLVYYLNKDDKSLYKYHINLVDLQSDSEVNYNTLFNCDFWIDNGQKIHHSYVGYNCLELGFVVAEKNSNIKPSICKYCKYNTGIRMLPCTIHPTLNHQLLYECKDFK